MAALLLIPPFVLAPPIKHITGARLGSTAWVSNPLLKVILRQYDLVSPVLVLNRIFTFCVVGVATALECDKSSLLQIFAINLIYVSFTYVPPDLSSPQ